VHCVYGVGVSVFVCFEMQIIYQGKKYTQELLLYSFPEIYPIDKKGKGPRLNVLVSWLGSRTVLFFKKYVLFKGAYFLKDI